MAVSLGLACTGTGADGPSATAQRAQPAAPGPVGLRVDVVARYPHDPKAFTQGLVLDDGVLYESTGLEGRSSLRRVDLATGRVLAQVTQPAPIFSEGLALVGPRLVQLTWKNGLAFQYDKKTLRRTRQWSYGREGWGACYDGRDLVTSDGSETLAFRDPETLDVRREVQVQLRGAILPDLNELECVDGAIYANVWNTDGIVRIDAATGTVTAVIDAGGLLTPAERAGTDVLNGIAYDPATKTFLITGKLWPTMFRARFVAR
jgi:glutaminyl-peptide cyclotransferase